MFNYHRFSVLPPAVSLHPNSRSRPGLLKVGDPGLPWLADSWPSTSLPANGGLGSPKGGSNFGRGGKKQAGLGENTVLAMPGWTVLMLIHWEALWQDITQKHAQTNTRMQIRRAFEGYTLLMWFDKPDIWLKFVAFAYMPGVLSHALPLRVFSALYEIDSSSECVQIVYCCEFACSLSSLDSQRAVGFLCARQ